MSVHLSHKINWDCLKNYVTPYNSSAISFPCCSCNIAHISNKKQLIQVSNRKYIDNNMICTKPNCKIIGTIILQKNRKTKPVFNYTSRQYLSSLKKEEYLRKFKFSFFRNLNEFKKSFYKKVMEIKNIPATNLSRDYLNKKINIYLGNNINTDDNWNYKNILNTNDTNVREWFGKYIEIYALSISDNYSDIRTIIELDKKNIISLLDVFNERVYGMGHCYMYILDSMMKLYLTLNLLIYCGYYDNVESWCRFNDRKIWEGIIEEDMFTILPVWRYKYFNNVTDEKDKDIGKNYLKDKTMIKNLMKDIFKYFYTWLFLKEYTDVKYNLNLPFIEINNIYSFFINKIV